MPSVEPGAFAVLASLPQLTTLDVSNMSLGDDDLLALVDFKALRQLDFSATKVTVAGLAKFKAARPEVKIETDIVE